MATLRRHTIGRLLMYSRVVHCLNHLFTSCLVLNIAILFNKSNVHIVVVIGIRLKSQTKKTINKSRKKSMHEIWFLRILN